MEISSGGNVADICHSLEHQSSKGNERLHVLIAPATIITHDTSISGASAGHWPDDDTTSGPSSTELIVLAQRHVASVNLGLSRMIAIATAPCMKTGGSESRSRKTCSLKRTGLQVQDDQADPLEGTECMSIKRRVPVDQGSISRSPSHPSRTPKLRWPVTIAAIF